MSTNYKPQVRKSLGTLNGVELFEQFQPDPPKGFENIDCTARTVNGLVLLALPIEIIEEWSSEWENDGYEFLMIGYSYPPVWWGKVSDFKKLMASYKLVEMYGKSFS